MSKSYQTEEDRRIDRHVGERIRLRRILLGLSQEKLADALGLTFQQVQKYERGANRVAASRLFRLSEILSVPVSFFFDGLKDGLSISDYEKFGRRELQLVRHYRGIENNPLQEQVYQLVKSLSGATDGSDDLLSSGS